MRKKLLIIPSWYPDETCPVGGIFIEDQAIVLSKDYEVVVAYIAPTTIMSWYRNLLSGRMETKARIENRNGISIYRRNALPIPQSRAAVVWVHYYLWAIQREFERIQAIWGKPDLIHAHVVLPAGWAAMKLGMRYEIPVVLTEHTCPFSFHLTSTQKQRLVRETLRGINRIVAISPALKQHIHDFYSGETLDVVGEVIRTDLFRPLLDEPPTSSVRSRPHFFSLALLDKRKGIHDLLEAARLLIQRGITDFKVVIGGDGPALPQLKAMAREFGLSEQCRFLGMLSRSEAQHQMQQCDVFVLPSLAETFGVVVGEAMACGKPVITTRCGGPEFVVTPETGILVDVADPVALANAMAEFISGKLRFDPLQIRRSVQERFGEKAFVRNISTIYEQLLRAKPVY